MRTSTNTIDALKGRINVADGRGERAVVEVFTGTPLTRVPIGTADDVATAFAAARAAQQAWAITDPSERAAILRRFADLVHQRRSWLLDIVQAETGKNRASALEELLDVLLVARFYAERGPGWLADSHIPGMIPAVTSARVLYEPVGVVGIIAPWNYPLSLGVSDGLAALIAGCGIVQKPDSQTPLSALAAATLMDEAGLPSGLWQIVTGAGRVVGTAIAEGCDFLMFTGSSTTGAALGEIAGRRLIGYSAELGGKNAMIVTTDADIESAARVAVRACFSSSGQLCISMERIYVIADAYEPFCEAFSRCVRDMSLGSGYEFGPEMGAMISADQRRVVLDHIEDAVNRGARVLVGGQARNDLGPTFLEPTVLVDVPPSATCHREETFGPLVSVYRAATLDEAVEQANDTPYGLNSAIFAGTDEEALAIARRLRTGMVNINEGYAPAWGSLAGPSGGMGISGVGYRHGLEGLRKYTHARTVATQSRRLDMDGPQFVPDAWWPHLMEGATNAMKWMPGR